MHGAAPLWSRPDRQLAGLVTVPVPPAIRIVHTGQGAYSVISVAGIPAWAIALIIIGVLVLVTMAVLLFRARQHRRYV